MSTAYLAVLDQAVKQARDGHLLRELGRSLSNLLSEVYTLDLTAAAELADEVVEVDLKIGDSYQSEITLTNAGFTWLLRGDWDRLVSTLTEWLDGRESTSATGSLWLPLARVYQARGEALLPPPTPPSEDPYEQLGTEVVTALALAAAGDLAGAAARGAAAIEATYELLEPAEDFEVMWAPVMELQIEAGRLDAATGLLERAEQLLAGRWRPLCRAELPRLRGMLKAARGEDPEADLREAEAAHEAYGAPYLLALTRLELARWLRDHGRGEEAAVLLAAARPVFVELRATPAIEATDELMRESVAV